MTVLVTGAAGFIGFHTALALLARGDEVVGIDNLNDYYDVSLKEARLSRLAEHPGFTFHRGDIADHDGVTDLFETHPDIDRIINLAAQAGVRYSLVNPFAYSRSNIEGHLVLLEAARNVKNLKHFVYASSSSVYGTNTKLPFSVEDRVDTPISMYAATKKSMEMISHAYGHLFGMRADGAAFLHGVRPVGAAGYGGLYLHPQDSGRRGHPGLQQRRYAAGLHLYRRYRQWCRRLPRLGRPPSGGPMARVYNIGNSNSESLMDYIGETGEGVWAAKPSSSSCRCSRAT